MSNHEIIESLDWITECIGLIRERFAKIRVPDDFVLTPEGITLLDAVSMRLQVIGETVKQIQKTNPSCRRHPAASPGCVCAGHRFKGAG